MLDYNAMYRGDTELEKLYLGITAIWEKQSPAPAYDETKLTVVLLDAQYEPTSTIYEIDPSETSPFTIAANYIKNDSTNYYLLHIGSNAGFTTIPDSALYDVDNLWQVDIPGSVETIGVEAFTSCNALKTVNFSNRLISIGRYAFNGFNAIESIHLPNTVTTIADHSFYRSTRLTDLVLSESLTAIPVNAFGQCTALRSVTIPASVTTISSTAFYADAALTQITVNKPQDSIADAPWGATNATVIWTG